MSNVTQPKVVAEKPREMGREEKRIIFDKLNEVYVNEKTGYSDGWSDEKIAKDLGVPRNWVSTLRDEMFGPEMVVNFDHIKENAYVKLPSNTLRIIKIEGTFCWVVYEGFSVAFFVDRKLLMRDDRPFGNAP